MTVMNLATAEKQEYDNALTPEQAVIAAFAQSRGDFNTWDYQAKYAHLVQAGKLTVLCGDFSAFQDRRSF